MATLNSTGTPTQFLHAAEAIHGDLGLLAKEDVVLCISNSGNSPEIASLAPFLKNYSSCLIGMTGNLNSKLAESSDIIISSAVEQEACPNQLAPTSSTTVQMALGDALAICLMELRDFKDTDFAKYHPGGSLGKTLRLQLPSSSRITNLKYTRVLIFGKSLFLSVLLNTELQWLPVGMI